jgi:hypothetical protein
MKKTINTSISTFKNIITADYLYVDKTKYIYDLVSKPFGQYFFSRPRRFGKSMTANMISAYYDRNRCVIEKA